jgi:hypothetical protein
VCELAAQLQLHDQLPLPRARVLLPIVKFHVTHLAPLTSLLLSRLHPVASMSMPLVSRLVLINPSGMMFFVSGDVGLHTGNKESYGEMP